MVAAESLTTSRRDEAVRLRLEESGDEAATPQSIVTVLAATAAHSPDHPALGKANLDKLSRVEYTSIHYRLHTITRAYFRMFMHRVHYI